MVKEDREGSEWMSLDQYMEESPDSLNKHIKKNIYTMARHFNQRVQAFITEIVMGKNNPMLRMPSVALLHHHAPRGSAVPMATAKSATRSSPSSSTGS